MDILSYVLGLFSARTTAKHNLVSTPLGVAPFSLLFAFFLTFSFLGQSALLGACALVFLDYLVWVFGKESGSSFAGHSTAAGARTYATWPAP